MNPRQRRRAIQEAVDFEREFAQATREIEEEQAAEEEAVHELEDEEIENDEMGLTPEGEAKKVKGWGANGALFNDANPSRSVHAQAQLDPAGVFTIQFRIGEVRSADNSPVGETNPTCNPIAEIISSIVGSDVRRKISVVSGASISGVAEVVSVNVVDQSSSPSGNQYSVDIIIARGTRSSTSHPPTYQPPGVDNPVAVAAGTFEVFPVEQDIGITSVEVTVTPADPTVLLPENIVQVIQEGDAGFLKVYDPRGGGFVALAPQTKRLRLVNNFPIGTEDVSMTVTFGIDG